MDDWGAAMEVWMDISCETITINHRSCWKVNMKINSPRATFCRDRALAWLRRRARHSQNSIQCSLLLNAPALSFFSACAATLRVMHETRLDETSICLLPIIVVNWFARGAENWKICIAKPAVSRAHTYSDLQHLFSVSDSACTGQTASSQVEQ